MRRARAVPFYYASEFWLSLGHAVSFTVTAVYFVNEVGMNAFELVLVGTAMELGVFLFEVPTGVVADTFSRRLSIITGWVIVGVSMVLVGATANVVAIILAYGLWGLGYTFTSGAYEAWITDEVGAERVGRVFARGQQLGYAGALLGTGVSVAIASASLPLAVATGGAMAVAFAAVAAFAMPETGFRRRPPEERESNVRELRRTAVNGARYVRAQPLLLLILAITFFAGASTESFDRLKEAHFIRDIGLPGLGSLDPVVWFGILSAVSMVLGLAAAQLVVRRFDRVGQAGLARLLFLVSAVQMGSVVVFALAGNFALAVAGFWLYHLTRRLIDPIYMTWVNQNITDGSVRATVISISGQSDAIGQVAGGPVLGALGAVFSVRTALLAGGALLAPALGLYARAIRHDGREPELEELPEPVEA